MGRKLGRRLLKYDILGLKHKRERNDLNMKFSIKGKNLFCACVIVCGILTGCSSENPAAGNDGPAVVPPSEIYRMSL